MIGRNLQITYDNGRPLAAYLGFPRPSGARAVRSEELGEGLVVDFDGEGSPLGLEIVNPEIVTGPEINGVLSSLGVPEMTKQELSPLPAA
jgi:uncharacterized protein YuzE